jgi:hypothetical protein
VIIVRQQPYDMGHEDSWIMGQKGEEQNSSMSKKSRNYLYDW